MSRSRFVAREPAVSGRWAAVLGLAVGAMHAYPLYVQLRQAYEREHLQYALFVPIAIALMATHFVRGNAELAPEGGFRVWALFAAGAALLACAAVMTSPWAATFALLLNAAGLILACGGPPLFRTLLPAWLCLLLLLPPPLGLDEELLANLQRLTVRGCERLYEWGGGLCLVSGATIRMPGGVALGVDRPCSGVNSFFATLACAAIALAWQRRGPIHALLTLAGGVGWVLAANILRVLACMIWSNPTLDLTTGWRHGALGFLTFALALGMTLSLDRLLLFFNPARIPDDDRHAGDRPGWSELRARRSVALPASALMGLAAAAGVVAMFSVARQKLPPLDYRFAAKIDPVAALPERLGPWRRESYQLAKRAEDHDMASRSHVWKFRNGLWEATVSLDYPYPGYHDLQPCYQNLGWTLTARDNGSVPTQFAPPAGDFVRMRFSNDRDQHLFVAFAAFEETGQPHPVGVWGQLLDVGVEKFWTQFRSRLSGQDLRLVKRVYQIQVACQSQFLFTPDQTQQLDELLFRCRQRLQGQTLTIAPFE